MQHYSLRVAGKQVATAQFRDRDAFGDDDDDDFNLPKQKELDDTSDQVDGNDSSVLWNIITPQSFVLEGAHGRRQGRLTTLVLVDMKTAVQLSYGGVYCEH